MPMMTLAGAGGPPPAAGTDAYVSVAGAQPVYAMAAQSLPGYVSAAVAQSVYVSEVTA